MYVKILKIPERFSILLHKILFFEKIMFWKLQRILQIIWLVLKLPRNTVFETLLNWHIWLDTFPMFLFFFGSIIATCVFFFFFFCFHWAKDQKPITEDGGYHPWPPPNSLHCLFEFSVTTFTTSFFSPRLLQYTQVIVARVTMRIALCILSDSWVSIFNFLICSFFYCLWILLRLPHPSIGSWSFLMHLHLFHRSMGVELHLSIRASEY